LSSPLTSAVPQQPHSSFIDLGLIKERLFHAASLLQELIQVRASAEKFPGEGLTKEKNKKKQGRKIA